MVQSIQPPIVVFQQCGTLLRILAGLKSFWEKRHILEDMLEDITSRNLTQLQAYAQGLRRRRPSRSAQLKEPRRTIELVSFLQHALFENTDVLVRLIDRRVSQLWRRASEEARRRRSESSSAEAFVTEVRQVLAGADVPVAERLGAIEVLLRRLDTGTLRAPCLAVRQREVLVGHCAQIRPLVKMLLSLDLRSDESERWRVLLDAWRLAYHRDLDYVTEQMCPPRSRAWALLREHPVSVLAHHAAEAQLLWEIRQHCAGEASMSPEPLVPIPAGAVR